MGVLDFGPFLALSAPARVRLEAAGTPVAFGPGEAIVREHEAAEAAYVILSGRVRVRSSAQLRTLAVLAAPAILGELAVLLDEPRMATASAASPVQALRLPAAALRDAIAAEPRFAAELRDFAAWRIASNFLRRDIPFGDLPAGAIAELAALLIPISFADGAEIVRENEREDDAYLLRTGDVYVVRGPAERHVAHLGAGSFLGEIAALTGTGRTAAVRAGGPVTAYRLGGTDGRRVVKRHRAVVARLESAMQARHAPRRVGRVEVTPAPDDPECVVLHEELSGTSLRLARRGLAVYEDLDGTRTLRDIAIREAERNGADEAGVFATVATLQAAGFATAPRITADAPPALLLRLLDLLLAPRLDIAGADRLATWLHQVFGRVFRRVFGRLFGRTGTIAALVLGTAGTVALARAAAVAAPGDLGTLGIGGLLVAFLGLAVAAGGHEAAHAIATKAQGLRVRRASVGLLFFIPVIQVDTSEAWFIARRRRLAVNAAGPLFNLALCGMLGIAATLTSGTAQALAIWFGAASLVTLLVHLSPVLDLDGSYLLEDLANVNALRRKALHFVFADLSRHPRRLRTRLERGLLLYTGAATAYVAGSSLLILGAGPRLVAGILPPSVDLDLRVMAGVGIAVGVAAVLIAPLVGEVRAARRGSSETDLPETDRH